MATAPKKATPAAKKTSAVKSIKPVVKATVIPVKPVVKKLAVKTKGTTVLGSKKIESTTSVLSKVSTNKVAERLEKEVTTNMKKTLSKPTSVKKLTMKKIAPEVKEQEQIPTETSSVYDDEPKKDWKATTDNKVTSSPPWENLPQEKAEEKPSVSKGFPLIPVYNGNSTQASYFSKTFDHTVRVNEEDFPVETGFIAMHRSVDLLSLSNLDIFIEKGFISRNDHLDPDIKLASLYLTIDGVDKFINTETMDHNSFISVLGSSHKDLSINVPIMISHNGETHLIHVSGTINIEHGAAYLTSVSATAVSVKGFMLLAKRINLKHK